MRRSSWLIVLLPFAVPALVLALQIAPSGPGVVDLRGVWEWAEVAGEGPPVGPWAPVSFPGHLAPQQAAGGRLWLRRSFDAEGPHAGDEDSVLVLGPSEATVLRARVNGTLVGEVGAFDSLAKADLAALEVVRIKSGLLRPGPNELTLEVRRAGVGHGGLADRRLLLGPASKLSAWQRRTTQFESLIKVAPLLALLLAAALVLVLRRLEVSKEEQRRLSTTLVCVLSAWAALALQSGLGTAGWLALEARQLLVVPAVTAFSVAFLELLAGLAHLPAALLRINRAAAVVGVVLAELDLVAWRYGDLVWPWRVWLVGATVAGAVVALRWARRAVAERRDLGAALMASTACALGGAALFDCVVQAWQLALPGLYGSLLGAVPALTVAVLVSRFIGLAERNRQLAETLSVSNQELASALVEAKQATQAKSEFLASVSHELRTPLNSIINIPEGLVEDFEVNGSGGVDYVGDALTTRKYLRILQTSSKHLQGVVNQVLDFSKLDVGRMALHRDRIDVGLMVEDVQRTLQGLASRRGISLVCTGELGGTFEADRVKVSQVLLNLGSNAMKFAPDGSQVELRVLQAPEFIEFRMVDQGHGIAQEHQQLIFEGFRQVEGGDTRRYGGTGLGLAISKRLTELHGGSLSLESEKGRGSTFIARFPREAVASEPITALDASRAEHTIVVVDDEPAVLETLRLSLRHLAKVNAVGVQDPRQALAAIEAYRPSLVVLDLMMPQVSGLTLLRQLRASPSLGRVPVLVLSAYHQNQAFIEHLGAKWMAKPWHAASLAATVRTMVGLEEAAP